MKSMNLHRLRLPFLLKILLISTIATLVVAVIELLLEQALFHSYRMYIIWDALMNENSLGSHLIPLTMAWGEGALAIDIGKRQPLRTIFHTSSLWILVLCLHLGIFVKILLGTPQLIINYPNAMTSTGIVIGVFVAGEKYWTKRW
ncbi:MAG: hypothetical protein KME64_01490 [Scytonematopsis contorta HA4267-MV1]|jgi:hypothetical protein|nr:hypothetical protein [Scytonematopsis contorta HA4267-MV1]